MKLTFQTIFNSSIWYLVHCSQQTVNKKYRHKCIKRENHFKKAEKIDELHNPNRKYKRNNVRLIFVHFANEETGLNANNYLIVT